MALAIIRPWTDSNLDDIEMDAKSRFFRYNRALLGTMFCKLNHQVGDGEPVIDYARILHDFFDTPVESGPHSDPCCILDEFCEKAKPVLPPWQDRMPGLLDQKRCPDPCNIEPEWLVYHRIGAPDFDYAEIHQFIRSILVYPGPIWQERLRKVLACEGEILGWASIVFEETLALGPIQVSEQRIVDVMSQMHVPLERLEDVAGWLTDLHAKHGHEAMKDCYLAWIVACKYPLDCVRIVATDMLRSEVARQNKLNSDEDIAEDDKSAACFSLGFDEAIYRLDGRPCFVHCGGEGRKSC